MNILNLLSGIKEKKNELKKFNYIYEILVKHHCSCFLMLCYMQKFYYYEKNIVENIIKISFFRNISICNIHVVHGQLSVILIFFLLYCMFYIVIDYKIDLLIVFSRKEIFQS